MKNVYETVIKNINDIITDPELGSVFDIEEEVQSGITESVKNIGFRNDRPIIVTDNGKGKYLIVDGHTRYSAAVAAGLEEIPVVIKSFSSTWGRIMCSVDEQMLQRNLTNGQKLKLVLYLKKKQMELRNPAKESLASNDANAGNIAEWISKKLHISKTCVERIIRVLKSKDQILIKKVEKEEISLFAADEILRGRARLEKDKEESGQNNDSNISESSSTSDDNTEVAQENQEASPSDAQIKMIKVCNLINILRKLARDMEIPIPIDFHQKLLEMKQEALADKEFKQTAAGKVA